MPAGPLEIAMSTPLVVPGNRVAAVAPAVIAQTCWPSTAAEGPIDWDRTLPMPGSVLHFVRDREIYGEGDASSVFFKVAAGVVRTCKFLSDGHRQIDAFHVAGDVFGFGIGARYRLSAEAVCDCTLISYPRRGLERLVANNGALAQELLSYAMRSVARAQDHSLLLGRRSAVARVAAFLMEWAQNSPGAQTVVLAMTRQDMADYLGLTIETVSRTLSMLERDAVIEFSTTRQIRFKDPAALLRLNS